MKEDAVYLRHILDAIDKIDSYAVVGKETFMTTTHWQDAIIRNLEIIGEATKRLSDALKQSNAEIRWRNVVLSASQNHPYFLFSDTTTTLLIPTKR